MSGVKPSKIERARELLASEDSAGTATGDNVDWVTSSEGSNIISNNDQWKQPVRVATTAAGTLASSFENGDTIDGITLATGDRILIKDQAAGAENGIYTVNASGAPTRGTDMDDSGEVVGALVFVVVGTTNAATTWRATNTTPPTIDTTAITFASVGGSGTVTSVALTVPPEFSVSGSPITTSGTLAVTKANETANTVWAGPTSGGAAQPTFRSLVTADMPAGGTPPDLSGMTIERSVQPISDYDAGWDTSLGNSRGFNPWTMHISRQGVTLATDCLLGSTVANASEVGDAWTINSGSGGTPTADVFQASHPGIVTLSTGTSTSGRSGFNSNNNVECVLFGSGKMRMGVVFKIPTLSDGTNTFTVRAGYSDSLAGDATDGAYFRYTNGVNSGKWERVTRNNSTETATDTGSTADTGWHTFEIEANAAGTSIEFFIDGSSVGSNTTNIPTAGGRETNMYPAYIVKSAGTTARTISVDAFWYVFEFTTAR